jgi:hypothetical protein
MVTLTGDAQLVTEQTLSSQARQGLGNKMYCGSMIAMLDCDPSRQPPMSQIVQNWTSLAALLPLVLGNRD